MPAALNLDSAQSSLTLVRPAGEPRAESEAYLTVEEIAAYLRVTKRTIWRRMKVADLCNKWGRAIPKEGIVYSRPFGTRALFKISEVENHQRSAA